MDRDAPMKMAGELRDTLPLEILPRGRRTGLSAAVALAERLAGRIRSLAVVPNLDFLSRSGRLGATAGLFGGLHAVPILEVADGKAVIVDSAAGSDEALAHLQQLVTARIPERARIHAAALHTNAPDLAESLTLWLRQRYECLELWSTDAGPLIAAHAGPGLVGLSWYREEDVADEPPKSASA